MPQTAGESTPTVDISFPVGDLRNLQNDKLEISGNLQIWSLRLDRIKEFQTPFASEELKFGEIEEIPAFFLELQGYPGLKYRIECFVVLLDLFDFWNKGSIDTLLWAIS
jgi:hypothetical protein